MPAVYEILTFLTYVIGGITALLVVLYHIFSQVAEKEESKKTTKTATKTRKRKVR